MPFEVIASNNGLVPVPQGEAPAWTSRFFQSCVHLQQWACLVYLFFFYLTTLLKHWTCVCHGVIEEFICLFLIPQVQRGKGATRPYPTILNVKSQESFLKVLCVIL